MLSSQIEGTQSSFSDLMLFESAEAPNVPLEDVQEVSNYVAAMNHGLRHKIEVIGRPAASVLRVHQHLQRKPIITIPATAEQLSLSAPTGAKALQHMVKLGMVQETTGKQRHRPFTYHHYLEILNRGTELPKASY